MIYLSGTYTSIPENYRHRFGYMLNVMRAIGKEQEARNYPWMLDNGAFSQKWDEKIWLTRLEKLSDDLTNCIGTVVPDVILDVQATRRKWDNYVHIVKSLGYKAFFATQNGCTPDLVPWDEIDGLFIGGSDDHRISECFLLIREAKKKKIWVHVGRVNSVKNIKRFCSADSVDGTHLVYESGNTIATEKLLKGVEFCNQQQHGQLSFLDLLQLHTQY